MLRNLLAIFVAVFCYASISFGQTLTTTRYATDDAANGLIGGSTGRVVFAISVDKTAGAIDFTNLVVSTGATDPSTVFSGVQLWTSATDFASASNTNATVTLGATSITFAGNPTNLFSYGAGAVTGRKFFVVATVRNDVPTTSAGVPTITLSVAETGTTYTGTPTETAFSLSGTAYTFVALEADFTQNADDDTALGDENDIVLLDFSVNSNGTQSLSTPLIVTFDVDVTNILENFDLQVGGVNIAGTESYTLNGAGTQLTIAAFTAVDVTASTTFTLLADIKHLATSSNDFIISLASSGATTTPGVPESFTTFTNAIDVTALEADFTQNGDDATAFADQNGVELLDFNVNSNGTQTISPNLVFTFNVDVTNILENWDLRVGGSDIAGTEIYTLNGAGTQLTISGFTGVDVTADTQFQLLADIKVGATSSSDFTISLVPGGVSIAPGFPEAFGTFSNDVDVTGIEADFTQNADDATAFADQNGVELLDFNVNSNGTQTISPNLVFTFNVDVTNILENWDLRVGGSDIAGTEIYTLNGAGTQLTISGFTGVDVTSDTQFQLLADIKVGATVTNDFTISLAPSGVNISPGIPEAFGTFSNAVDIVTSQNSDIFLNGNTTNAIAYENAQDDPISGFPNGSVNLADYLIRDGGGSNDGDVKGMSVTSIEIQITNAENVRNIVLYDDSDDSEILGTQQAVSGTGTVNITFTPTTPIAVPDNGSFEFKVRASFEDIVTDNHAIRVSIVSAVAASTGSGFSPVGGWTSTQTAINTNIIDVDATKFIVNCSPTTQAIGAPFTITVEAVDDLFENRDRDYNGKIDLTRSPGGGSFTAAQGFTGQSLALGIFTWTNAQFSVSNTYTITANDNAYDPPAPEAQQNLENGSKTITISASSSSITQATDPVLCYGGATASETLSNIVITETDPAGISGSNGTYTFSLALPAGFVFDQSVTTGVSLSGADLNTPSGYTYTSANVVEFSFNLSGTATTGNSITISGLKVRYPHPGTESPAPTGVLNITRSGGTASIAGVVPGTVLGSVSALQNNPAVDFTVTATVGNIDANTTSYNVSSPPVNLIGEPTVTPVGVFSGSGVTPGPFRFNPNTLAQGDYDITYLQTSANGCQSVKIKTFTVFDSGIGGLNASYCSNADPSSTFTVSGTFINNIFGGGYSLDHYTYYDPFVYRFNLQPVLGVTANATIGATFTNNGQTFTVVQTVIASTGETGLLCTGTGVPLSSGVLTKTSGTGDAAITYSYYYNGDFRPILSPANNQFDPELPAYQTIYNYFGGRIPIGFAVCNGSAQYPCNGNSNYGTYSTYQWVIVNPAPNVSFDLPASFCRDGVPVPLIGSPPNGNNTNDDKFTASGGQGGSISNSLVPPVTGDQVWTFTPSAVSGEAVFSITYQYKDPATGCFNTFSRNVNVYDVPSAVPAADITKSIPGPPSSTTIRLCAGGAVGNFSATNNTYSYKWYADPVGPANVKSVLPTFSPAVNNLVAANTPFYVTRVRNGCESITTPLALSVNVIAAPPAPTPNFNDVPTRLYCVNGTINDAHLGVPGTNVKWYNSLGAEVYAGSFPQAINDLGLSTAAEITYSFNVTQTEAVNGCEGPGTPITVKVQALPVISIAPIASPIQICTTAPTYLKLTPTDQGNPAPGLGWTVDPSPGSPGVLTNFNGLDGTVELNPLTGTPGTYTLRYTYTNAAGCANSGTRDVRIFPTVTPNVSIAGGGVVCNLSPAIINNASTISAGTSTISRAQWEFGDGKLVPLGAAGSYTSTIDPTLDPNTSGTYEDPLHIYPDVGTGQSTFQLEGVLVTSDGCSYNIPQIPVTVSPLPVANFISENVCVNSPTVFTATTSIPVASYDWDFSKDNVLDAGTSTGATNTTSFSYSITGKDHVELTVATAAGCEDVVTKPIYSLPNYGPIITDVSYLQDFTTNDGWLTGGTNSSWQLVTPVEAPLPLTGIAWDTKNDLNDENSWVISGCFDFSNSQKPVISLDTWSDVPLGVDGAVLQYNITGNIEDNVTTPPDSDGDWVTLGEVGSGINWYDENGISNNPGSQETVSAGWTGKYAQWRKAIFKLDDVKGNAKVVFRIAFASSLPRGTGFTFDNVFVGERSRAVLLESFTNASVTPKNHNDTYHDFGDVTTGELVKIQYHTAFPGDDPLNELNRQMNNARAAFYGITESPSARLDGDYRNGNLNTWINDLNDDRVLTPSALKLNGSTAVKDGPIVRVRAEIENTTNQKIPLNTARLFVVVVEKTRTAAPTLSSDGEFVYVAKQMLPSAAGIELPDTLFANEVLTAPVDFPEAIWEGQDGDAIAIFIQRIEGNNKNVMQAFLLPNPQVPDPVTGIEDPQYAEKISLFPNPANHEVNVQLPAAVSKVTPVQMMDTYGRIVYEGSFAVGEQSKPVNTSDLTGGVYILQISTPEGNVARRKIMVIHR
jgi:hypothetical protein